jgi:hypothetical protein
MKDDWNWHGKGIVHMMFLEIRDLLIEVIHMEKAEMVTN